APRHLVERSLVGVERDCPVHQPVDGAKIIDSMQMIGMGMGQDDRVETVDLGGKQLLAQIGRGVDQHGLAAALDQQRGAAPAVARVRRVAGAPIGTDRRHAGRRTAAEERRLHGAGGTALAKSRKKFAVVAAASASGVTPFSAATKAAVAATKAGSL